MTFNDSPLPDATTAAPYSVVVADDSPTLRRIVAAVLERAGFEVTLAEDGVEAVQAVFRTQPDAVVLDVQMPRVSGYVAARVLKDDWQTADDPRAVPRPRSDAGQRPLLGRPRRRRPVPHQGLRGARAGRGRAPRHRGGRSGPRGPGAAASRTRSS